MLPVILLAFANDKENAGAGYLRGLTRERNAIRDALAKAEENGLCQVLVEPDATIDRIFDIFQNSQYRDRIALFHYGGHAESYALLLESAAGGKAIAHSEGLVGFLAKQKSLKLVFLNGCSSQKQSEDLVTAGVPAVIGTSQLINDTVATNLSTRFYKGMAAGMNINRAWTDAVDQVKTETDTTNTQSLFVESILGSPGEDVFPWKLYQGEGSEISLAWNLPEAADQPLFGLELPKSYYRKLPLNPYPGLRSFTREEAAIFFGRGSDIRKIHSQLSREQPLIIVSGKKGVGKSSLFHAGLAPRLESSFTVAEVTYTSDSSVDGISFALEQIRQDLGLAPLPPKDKSQLEEKIAALQFTIASTSGFSKIILSQELEKLEEQHTKERLSFYEQWIEIEEKSGRPLVLLLDDLHHDIKDWELLHGLLLNVFDVANPPKGKLVLNIDGEHRYSFCYYLDAAGFPYSEIFLLPLTWEGIQESITGCTRSPATKDYYRLRIDDNAANNLPSVLSDDLMDGHHTLVAPYLQVVLTALWDSAIKENVQTPVFTLGNYQKMILAGDVMDKFLTLQLAKIKEWNYEVVDSGLALDVLYLHTSALGKSNLLESVTRKEIYGDRQELVNNLIEKCKELFLLTSAPLEGTQLGHNLLAMVVIRQYSNSVSPGQQAARILNSRSHQGTDSTKASWLNEKDLETVESGMSAMRSLTEKENALLTHSREKKIQAQKDRARNRFIRAGLISIVAIFAVLAGWQWHVASQRYLYSRAGELALTAREELKKDNTIALDIAYHAYATLGEKSPPLVFLALSDIFHSQDEVPFYAANFPHSEKVFSAVFSPDGNEVLTTSEDGFAKLWTIEGKELLTLPHEIEVTKGTFSPNGQQILTLTRTHVSLWERDGTLTDRDTIAETVTSLDSFSTDGMKIIPNYSGNTNNEFYSNLNKLQSENNIVIPSPSQERILTLHDGVLSIYNGQGQIIRDSITTNIYHTTFSNDSKQFLTVVPNENNSLITVRNGQGDSLYSFLCRGNEVSATFSPDGKSILTASNDFSAKLWDFSNPFLHRFPKQHAAINSIDYFPEGDRYITTSFDSSARIWNGAGQLIDSHLHGDVVTSAIFSPDGSRIVTTSRDSTARLWDPKSGRIVILQHENEVTTASFSNSGDVVLTSSLDSTARTWDLIGVQLHTYRMNGDVTWSGFANDDKTFATISSDHVITIWDIAGDSLHMLRHPDKIYSVSFSKDGSKLITSCADSIVRVWSAEGKLVSSLRHFEKPKFALFTDDGNYIITGGKLVKIWCPDGVLEDSLVHHENVSSIDVSPDGKYILTTSFDHLAYLWNFHGELLTNYRKHTAKINQGIFTKDGNHILTAADDGYVYRWRTPWAIYHELKSKPVYQLSKKELESFGIVR